MILLDIGAVLTCRAGGHKAVCDGVAHAWICIGHIRSAVGPVGVQGGDSEFSLKKGAQDQNHHARGECIRLPRHTLIAKAATRHGLWLLLLSIYQIRHVG